MKIKLLLILLVQTFVLTIPAVAQGDVRNAVENNRSFSLNASLAFDNYGYLNSDKMGRGTEYAGLKLSPDWRFAPHWGLKLGLGAGWAFASNATGEWLKPMLSICNISLALAPYYEFNIRRWFVDLGIVAGCRVRLPYMNQEPSRYLQTLSFGLGADLRFGYMITKEWGIVADVNVQRTLYDKGYSSFYDSQPTSAGLISASLGFVCRLKTY